LDRATWRLYGWVALGGALGSVLRAALAGQLAPGAFPWPVFGINVGGSLLVGVVMTLSLEAARLGAEARTLLATGLLGGFTTFSTFAGELVALAGTAPAVAVLYGLGSLGAGLGAALAGQAVVRAVWLRAAEPTRDEEEAAG
jgi:CrcB protein